MRLQLLYISQGLLLLALAFFSFLMLKLSLPYLEMKGDIDFLRTKENVYHIKYWRLSFYLHVFTGSFALIAGLTQFSSFLLRRYRLLHRSVGYTYVLVVVGISGPSGFIMGLHANGGLPARTSFVILAFLWILFTLLAWYFGVRKNLFNTGPL